MKQRTDVASSAPDAAGGLKHTISLTKRSVTALKWSYLGVGARIFMQVAAQILLARLLGPVVYGVVAAAALVLAICSLISDLGFGAALVQSRSISERYVRSAFTKVFVASIVVALGVYFFAEWIAELFGSPDVKLVIRWMLPAFLLQSWGVVSLGLLRRELDFKSIQIAQTSGYFLGFLVAGVGCALLGLGVWSLVVAWTVQNLSSTIILYMRARHPIAPVWIGGAPLISRFSLGVMLTNISNWLIENIDNLVVGKAFGTQTLGGYAVAYSLVRTPANHAVSSIQQVLFPASARAQNSPETLRSAYFAATWVVGITTFPVFFGVGAVSDTVVAALYGAKWISAAALLLPLALAMPFHAVMAVAGPLLWGRGEVGREFKVQIWVALALSIATVSATAWSAEAVAWAVLLVYVGRAAWLHLQVARSLGVPFKRVLAVLLPSGCVALLIGLTLLVIDTGLRRWGLGPLVRLLLEMTVAAGVLVFVVYIFIGVLVPRELRSFIPKIAERLPLSLSTWLQVKMVRRH